MKISRNLARQGWYVVCFLFFAESMAMFGLAPAWEGGGRIGEIHGLACFVAGLGVTCLLLGASRPGASVFTQALRYMFALNTGAGFQATMTWGLWAVGYPIENGTIQRGLMGTYYWLGPAALLYAGFAWAFYRYGLVRDSRRMCAS